MQLTRRETVSTIDFVVATADESEHVDVSGLTLVPTCVQARNGGWEGVSLQDRIVVRPLIHVVINRATDDILPLSIRGFVQSCNGIVKTLRARRVHLRDLFQ